MSADEPEDLWIAIPQEEITPEARQALWKHGCPITEHAEPGEALSCKLHALLAACDKADVDEGLAREVRIELRTLQRGIARAIWEAEQRGDPQTGSTVLA